jgi:hypothetical protein
MGILSILGEKSNHKGFLVDLSQSLNRIVTLARRGRASLHFRYEHSDLGRIRPHRMF